MFLVVPKLSTEFLSSPQKALGYALVMHRFIHRMGDFAESVR
jgi:hypothetical protein